LIDRLRELLLSPPELAHVLSIHPDKNVRLALVVERLASRLTFKMAVELHEVMLADAFFTISAKAVGLRSMTRVMLLITSRICL
jgi:hypothetical protein